MVTDLRILSSKSRAPCAALILTFTLVASTATADMVVVVSAKSTITSLSDAQVTDIFLGKLNRFPNGSVAVPIDQAESSPAREEFYASHAGKSLAQIRSYWAKLIFTGRGEPPKAVANSIEVRKLLAANPQAISYIERSAVDSTVRILVQP